MKTDMKTLSMSMGSDGSGIDDYFDRKRDEMSDMTESNTMDIIPVELTNLEQTLSTTVTNLNTVVGCLNDHIATVNTVINNIADVINEDPNNSGKMVESFSYLLNSQATFIKEIRSTVKGQQELAVTLLKERNKMQLASEKMKQKSTLENVGRGGVMMSGKELAAFARACREGSELHAIEAKFEEVREA